MGQIGETHVIKVQGKTFRCTNEYNVYPDSYRGIEPCGCNCFTKISEIYYRCNACGTEYEGIKNGDKNAKN